MKNKRSIRRNGQSLIYLQQAELFIEAQPSELEKTIMKINPDKVNPKEALELVYSLYEMINP